MTIPLKLFGVQSYLGIVAVVPNAADVLAFLKHGHAKALDGEVLRGGHTGNSRSDDDHSRGIVLDIPERRIEVTLLNRLMWFTLQTIQSETQNQELALADT